MTHAQPHTDTRALPYEIDVRKFVKSNSMAGDNGERNLDLDLRWCRSAVAKWELTHPFGESVLLLLLRSDFRRLVSSFSIFCFDDDKYNFSFSFSIRFFYISVDNFYWMFRLRELNNGVACSHHWFIINQNAEEKIVNDISYIHLERVTSPLIIIIIHLSVTSTHTSSHTESYFIPSEDLEQKKTGSGPMWIRWIHF